jgi:hypothetical protein
VAGGPGPGAPAQPVLPQAAAPAAAACAASASKPPAPRAAAAAAADEQQRQQAVETVANNAGDEAAATPAAAPAVAEDNAPRGAAAASPPVPPSLAGEAQAAHAMFLGQALLTMAQVFPGMAAVVGALTSMMQGAAAVAAGSSGVAPAALAIAPLSAPAFVQTTFGDVLAARVAAAAPKGAAFTLEHGGSATPLKSSYDDVAGMETKTPVSVPPNRSAAAARKTAGDAANPLAFLAMAASMERGS